MVSLVPSNPDAWSAQSKRSRGYEPGVTGHYYDEYYWCRKCGAPAVFSAAEQKYRYEVLQRHICQTRILCNPCWKKSNKNRRGKAVSADRAED